MKNLIKVLSICGLMAIAAPAFAQISFDIQVGPPPPRHEVIVAAPYPEAVWVPGYHFYDYGIHDYRWIPGVWQRPPHPGARWIAPRYAQRGGRYGYVAGHWGDHGGRGGHGGNGRGRGDAGRSPGVGERR